jgi:hypothetical protein
MLWSHYDIRQTISIELPLPSSFLIVTKRRNKTTELFRAFKNKSVSPHVRFHQSEREREEKVRFYYTALITKITEIIIHAEERYE